LKIRKIEIDFPCYVDVPNDFGSQLHDLINAVCKLYERDHPDRVMWPAGHGSKMTYMPITREEERVRGCEFDEDIYHIGVAERGRYDKDK